jgi:hypothetical protein
VAGHDTSVAEDGWVRAARVVVRLLVVVAVGFAVTIGILVGTSSSSHNNPSDNDTQGNSGVITIPTTTSIAGQTAAHANLPTISLGGTWTGRQPTTIGFSGDAGNVVSDIAWASWTDTGAVGHGTWDSESCVPSCATGSTIPYAATITLSDPVGGQFTALIEQTHGMSQSYTLPGTNVGPWGS